MTAEPVPLPGLESYTVARHLGGFGYWVCRGEYRKGHPDCILATCRSWKEAELICNSLNLTA